MWVLGKWDKGTLVLENKKNEYGGSEEQIHSFLISILDTSQCSQTRKLAP